MKKPDLDRIWETWIRIGIPTESRQEWVDKVVDVMRSCVWELVSVLEGKKVIEWYQFLVHPRENDGNLYFHVRFSLRKDVGSEEFLKLLPSYCLYPVHVERREVESISGVTSVLLKGGKIEEAWRIMGEQSEWMLHLIEVHEADGMLIEQFAQFMHYYLNMVGLDMQGLLFISPFIRF
jgi:DNA-binding Lrp family transcriptional regulator